MMQVAARICDLVEDGDPLGTLALQLIDGRPLDRLARAVLAREAAVLSALADPVMVKALRGEFFGGGRAGEEPGGSGGGVTVLESPSGSG